MIYCIWYPSGGFGHFLNGIISLHGTDFVRPKKKLEFSTDGNSHDLDCIAPKYLKDPENYTFNFDHRFNYSVLIDNGINNEGQKFLDFFPDAKIIKVCYNDYDWPVVANTMIHKAMLNNFDDELSLNPDKWNSTEAWAVREKYFLFLRDHPLRKSWKPSNETFHISVKSLLTYQGTKQSIENTGIILSNFEDLWNQWWKLNKKYFDPILNADEIVNGSWPSEPITDLWNQAVVYYRIWCEHGIEVPHNDFPDFFRDQTHLTQWLKK